MIHGHALLTVGRLLNSYDLTDVDAPAPLDQLGPLGDFRSPFVRDDGMLAVWHGYDLRLYDCSDPADIHSAMALPFVLDAAHPYGGPISMDDQRVVTAARHGAQQFLLPQGSGGITDGGVAWWRLEGSLLAATDRWAWVQGDRRYAIDLIGGGTGRARIAGALDNGGLGSGTRFLAHHAGHLFYARGDGRLRIEDVADPLAPVLVNSLDGGFDAIALADGLLAAARGLSIEFYDVSSPATPVPLGLLEVDDHVAAVGLHADRSYAVIRTEGRDDSVYVFDLADPTAPEVSSAVAFDDQDPETLWQVAHHVLHGTTLLLDMRDGTENVAYAWRTNAIDLQDPATPVLTEPMGYADFWSHISDIAPPLRFAGHHAMADVHALRLYRYTGDPGDGSEALASLYFARQIAAMQASGTRLAVLSPSLLCVFTLTGIEPVPVPDGTPAAAVTVAPNPFNPRTTIAFSMRRPGRATVAIHDLRGRRVRTLARRPRRRTGQPGVERHRRRRPRPGQRRLPRARDHAHGGARRALRPGPLKATREGPEPRECGSTGPCQTP